MERKLSEVCWFYSGTGFPVTYQGKDKGELPFYKVGDISNNVAAGNMYLSCCNNYISRQEATEIKGSIIPPYTIVFAKIGEALKLNRRVITNCDCLIDNNVIGIKPNRDYLRTRYFYYYMKRLKMQDYAESTAVPSVRKSKLEQIKIDIPSLEEQERMEQALDKASAIIIMRQQQLQKLDELVKARFVEMFGDESNPYNFPIVNIEDVASVQVGVVIKPAQYYTDAGHGIKTFRSLNIGPMHIKDTDWVYFSEEGNRKNQKSVLNENDLVIVRSGAPGTACVITKEYAGCNAVDIIIARPDLGKVNPYYLCQYTNLPHGKKQIEEGTGGAAQQHFNVGKYNKIRLTLPPLDQQLKFEKFVEQTDKSKVAVQKALDEAQLLFDSLMQKYFG